MINRLTMQYNRGRQAAITNELVDIITGMSRGWSLYLQSLNCLFQVLVRSECQDVDRRGRCRVSGCRLAHVIFVPPVTIVLNFYPTFFVVDMPTAVYGSASDVCMRVGRSAAEIHDSSYHTEAVT